ncbi:hypothetical protein [Bacillus sp. FJAT-45037]|uniref:hypothetical protein n=1 Tax=Bacillus sp. FJAT-45037 TaxID=2011007 RepID=UPI0012FD9313|nr:hypothetical protein [Bacillus sp. FJAT-45037]
MKADWVGRDIGEVKRKVKAKGITIHELGEEQMNSLIFVKYMIVYKGQEREMKILNRVMRNNVHDILKSYVNNNL